MAYPMPSATLELILAVLMPMTAPLALSRAPPLLPGLMAASVWMSSLSNPSMSICRFVAETMPVVTDWPYPSAFPMAMVGSPTFTSLESPRVAMAMASMVESLMSERGTATMARSLDGSVPLRAASTLSLSAKVTVRVSAPSTTWLLVAIRSSVSDCWMMMPEPRLSLSCCWVWPKKLCTSCTLMLVMETMDGMASSTMPDTSDITVLDVWLSWVEGTSWRVSFPSFPVTRPTRTLPAWKAAQATSPKTRPALMIPSHFLEPPFFFFGGSCCGWLLYLS